MNKNQILGNIDLLKLWIATDEPNKIKVLQLIKKIEKDYKDDLLEGAR